MRDVELIFEDSMPPHAVSAAVDGDTVRVTVSPDVEADVLSILDQPLGLAVAKAVREAREA
jgi:hypothetical protein